MNQTVMILKRNTSDADVYILFFFRIFREYAYNPSRKHRITNMPILMIKDIQSKASNLHQYFASIFYVSILLANELFDLLNKN